MFKSKKSRRRRSEVRLGAQAANFETTSSRPTLSLAPVLDFWQMRGVKLVGLVTLALLMWAFYALFASAEFFVYSAEVKGIAALSRREIYTAAGIDSQSVFWLNPTQIAQRVAGLPNVKSASVSITLPARVTIEVVERRPQLLWQTGDQIWWVDEEGTIVPPKTDVEDMLKIIDDDMQPLEAGYQIDRNIIKGAQALRLLAPDVSIIRHTRAQGLIVATPEGWPVYLGDGSEMRAKLLVLSAMLPDLREEEEPPLYIDLRNPLRPFFKLRPEVKPTPPRPQLPPARFPLPPARPLWPRPPG